MIHVSSWALTVSLLDMTRGYDIVYHLIIPLTAYNDPSILLEKFMGPINDRDLW